MSGMLDDMRGRRDWTEDEVLVAMANPFTVLVGVFTEDEYVQLVERLVAESGLGAFARALVEAARRHEAAGAEAEVGGVHRATRLGDL